MPTKTAEEESAIPAMDGDEISRSSAMAALRTVVQENGLVQGHGDADPQETREWLESLDWVLHSSGPDRAKYLLRQLKQRAIRDGVEIPFTANTPYINTIPPEQQPEYPGDRELERRIKSFIRWNAMAMVVRANKNDDGIGGHIATTPRRPRCTKSALTTSSEAPIHLAAAIRSTSRATPPLASTRARTWKAGSTTRTSPTSATNCGPAEACRRIRTLG
jgi:hypothetical protein